MPRLWTLKVELGLITLLKVQIFKMGKGTFFSREHCQDGKWESKHLVMAKGQERNATDNVASGPCLEKMEWTSMDIIFTEGSIWIAIDRDMH